MAARNPLKYVRIKTTQDLLCDTPPAQETIRSKMKTSDMIHVIHLNRKGKLF